MRTNYLQGYIAATEYIGGEWTLTKGGRYSRLFPKSAAEDTGVHKSREAAIEAGRAFKSRNPAERVYVRAYALESSVPQNLPLIETAQPLQYL